MRNRLTKILAGLAALAALALGGAALAGAGQNGSQPSESAAEGERNDDGAPAYRSALAAPEQENQSEQAEASSLKSKATVSSAQAKDAALAAVPGTAGEVELDNENGNVVYSVEITKADGTVVDVKIDAGNAKVLHQEADEADDQEGPEQADD